MRNSRYFAPAALAFGLLCACQPEPASGVFACARESDCPDGFVCRPDAIDGVLRCYGSGTIDAGAAHAHGDAGLATDAGQQVDGGPHHDAALPNQSDAGSKPIDGGIGIGIAPPPASLDSLGEPRSGGPFTLLGDGFEFGERQCTADKRFCITGGLQP